jgi:hypothetical protein
MTAWEMGRRAASSAAMVGAAYPWVCGGNAQQPYGMLAEHAARQHGDLRVKTSGAGMSQMRGLLALPDVSHRAMGARAWTLRPEGGVGDDADRMYRRVSRAGQREREPRWTTMTQRFRFRISRLLSRGTRRLTTMNMIPLPASCRRNGTRATRPKCRD